MNNSDMIYIPGIEGSRKQKKFLGNAVKIESLKSLNHKSEVIITTLNLPVP